MTKANDRYLSVEELVATLRNSSLPTLLVEGRSDMDLYCALEEMCFGNKIDVLPVGGRVALFEVFERRSEFPKTPVAFLADSDMFIFSQPAPELSGIIFTAGYSIENDILCGGKALRMMAGKNKPKWGKIMLALSSWFAAVAHRTLHGETVTYKQHPSQLVCFASAKFTPLSEALMIDPELLCAEAKKVLSNPTRYLRGHTLLDALGHFLASVKHTPRCGKDLLLRVDLVCWDTNRDLVALVNSVKSAIPQLAYL